jgi:hypothetical protein
MAWLGDPKDERSEWKPMTYFDDDNKKKALVKLLRALKIGYPDDTPEGWWSPKLQWLKLVEPGVWEFYYTEAYTD